MVVASLIRTPLTSFRELFCLRERFMLLKLARVALAAHIDSEEDRTYNYNLLDSWKNSEDSVTQSMLRALPSPEPRDREGERVASIM